MPTIGELAPDFTLPNQYEQMVRLSDFRGQRVVLFTFPQANTPGCNTQACRFRDEFPYIENLNAVVLGISDDTPADLLKWKQLKHLPYDLLSDVDHQMMEAWGVWGQKLLGVVTLPRGQRSYWVIDENGVIVDGQVGVRPVESVMKALKALRNLDR
jgi:peroxiredoxin Q/BCP